MPVVLAVSTVLAVSVVLTIMYMILTGLRVCLVLAMHALVAEFTFGHLFSASQRFIVRVHGPPLSVVQFDVRSFRSDEFDGLRRRPIPRLKQIQT